MLTPSDVLSHYRSVSDATHRFWAYFQAIALGTAAFAWSQDDPSPGLLLVLSIAFSAFAYFNHRLVASSQHEAVIAAASLKSYAAALVSSSPGTVPSYVPPILAAIRPEPVFSVRLWHAVIVLATVAAIWLRPLLDWCHRA